MQALVDVVLPVFLVIGLGYFAVARGLFPDAAIDGLMHFAASFAIPCLLFLNIATLDLGRSFDLALLGSYYTGAIAGFIAGIAGARLLFARPWPDSVAIGFVCLFSNSLLLGLPITERAYGAASLGANYAIIALHSPICYTLGITTMEIVRSRGSGLVSTARGVVRGMFHNALVIGIALGFVANFSGVVLPGALVDALEMMSAAAIPAALFGLGGVLRRYRPEGDGRTIAYICAVSLALHPAIVWGMGRWTGLDVDQFRSAVITASVAPGINGYIFASMYGVAKRVAASATLIGTALTILTAWLWLAILP